MYKEKIHRLYSPRLNKLVRIRVYLPPSYDGKRKYPVLYMHDGQNAVRPARWSHESWKVTETLEKMRLPLIVVGVDSDAGRSATLSPWKSEIEDKEMEFDVPHGKDYADFLSEYVKPFVDFTYKTRPDYRNTYLAGSSLGGLAAAYLSALHPGIYSCVGVFSLATWFVDRAFYSFLECHLDLKASYFLAVGGKESYGELMTGSYLKYGSFLKKKKVDLTMKVYPNDYHSEECWASQFRDFVRLIKARRKLS